jgi:hypothetical protein
MAAAAFGGSVKETGCGADGLCSAIATQQLQTPVSGELR